MTSRASKPPNPPSIAISSLLTPILTLILGIILAKQHSGHLHHIIEPIHSLFPECPPSRICPFFYRRSKLPSGKLATRLFDVPRRHLHSSYAALSSIAPNTRLVQQWQNPRVVVFDGGFDPLVKFLLSKADGNFYPTTAVDDHGMEVVDDNRRSDTAFVSPHREDLYLNELTDFLVRLIGLPNRHYSEVIEINRYNETAFFAIHHDFLSPAAILDKSPFHGCQRIATAVLQLTDVEGGETVFIKDPNFKGGFDAIDRNSDDVLIVPSKRGRLLAWFNLHPDTEEVDYSTWHGSMPVVKGQKIAATFYLRNCSQADNSRRMAQIEDFLKEAPAPSTGVNEGKSRKSAIEELRREMADEDDDEDGDEEGENDSEEGEYFDPVEDGEYMKDLRRYRTIRDAGGNTTEALLAAGYEEEDFANLDNEVIILDTYEDKMEADNEFATLKEYKRIKEQGEDVVEKLKEAGFEEDDFEMMDKELEIFADKIGASEDEEAGDDSLASDAHPEEKDHLEAERELGMDEETIRSFNEQLREHGLAEDEDEGDDTGDGDVLEEGEVGMDEESIRVFEKRLREEQVRRGSGEQDVVDSDDWVEDEVSCEDGEFYDGDSDRWDDEEEWGD